MALAIHAKIKSSGITDFTRIVTLCDVFDAVTSERVYKTGRSSLDAMKILYQNRGSKFDAKLVTEFYRMYWPVPTRQYC